MTHAELVTLAAKWLAKKHSVVITEMATTGEEPDAIGWRCGNSTLVECKVSRSDFDRDCFKPFRRDPARGKGQYRYFLTPPGLLTWHDLPKGWGLLEVRGNKAMIVFEAAYVAEYNKLEELALLVSALRRVGSQPLKGISVRHYTIEGRNRATLGTENEEL